MTWSRFDDAARKHPKAQMAGNEAWGFWCAAIMYCNQYGTDGFIPDAALATEVLPNPISKKKAKELADQLCESRIAPDGSALFRRDNTRKGYLVHDFLEWNPSKADVDSKRKRDRERKGIRTDSARNTGGVPDGKREDSGTASAKIPIVPACAGAGAPTRDPARPPAQPEDPSPPAHSGSSLQERAVLWLTDKQVASLSAPNPESWAETQEAVAVLAVTFGHTGPQSPRHQADPRMLVLLARWSEGYTITQVALAIQGAALDEHIAKNPQFQTLTTILRDAAQVDKFIALWEARNKAATDPTKGDDLGAYGKLSEWTT